MSLGARTSSLTAGLLAVALAACGSSAQGTSAGASSPAASTAPAPGAAVTPCGPAAAETLATTAGYPATQIYTGELASSETRSDQHQVEGYGPLLSAVESGNRAAITTAVTSLVYSHTHIVRLRVSKGSKVLADVGGPYILAPIGGSLRSHGRTIGSYLLSVQDDVGYVKLETRFIGAPLVMRLGSRQVPIEGLLTPGPASIPQHGPVRYRNVNYEAFSFNASAFPSGPLRISLLLPVPSSLSAKSCSQVKSFELERIAQRLSRLFSLSPTSFSSYIKLTQGLTRGLIYIRSGSRQLAGSTQPGPSGLPSSGVVSYRGTSYEVSSFAASTSLGPVRIYQLVAP